MVNGGGRMEGRKDGRTDGRTSRNSPLCSTGHRPFGAAAQKAQIWQISCNFFHKLAKLYTILLTMATKIGWKKLGFVFDWRGNQCSFIKKALKLISRFLLLKFFTQLKKKQSKIQLFYGETRLNFQESFKVGKMNGGVWSFIELSIIEDQSQHSSSIHLDLAREWRYVVKTSHSQILAIPDFMIYKGSNTAAKVLVSPWKSL